MLLILIFLGIGLPCLCLGIIGVIRDWNEQLIANSYVMAIVMALILCILGIVIGINHVTVSGDTMKLQQEYESLYYQASHHMYNNENEIGKKELMNQIQEYNAGLVSRKYYSKSPWFNWFYAIDYDQFEEIPYELVE